MPTLADAAFDVMPDADAFDAAHRHMPTLFDCFCHFDYFSLPPLRSVARDARHAILISPIPRRSYADTDASVDAAAPGHAATLRYQPPLFSIATPRDSARYDT